MITLLELLAPRLAARLRSGPDGRIHLAYKLLILAPMLAHDVAAIVWNPARAWWMIGTMRARCYRIPRFIPHLAAAHRAVLIFNYSQLNHAGRRRFRRQLAGLGTASALLLMGSIASPVGMGNDGQKAYDMTTRTWFGTAIGTLISSGKPWFDLTNATFAGGAVADSIRDNTAAFKSVEAAITIAGAGLAYLPAASGTYVVTQNVPINMASNSALAGSGRTSIIEWKGVTAQPTIINNPTQSFNANRNNQVNLTVRDIAIQGVASTLQGVAGGTIYFSYAQGIYVTNVTVNGVDAIAVRINACKDITVTDCELKNCAGGVWTPESDAWVVQGNRMYSTTDDAIATYGGDGANGFDATNGVVVGNYINNALAASSAITIDIASTVTTESKGVFRLTCSANTIDTCNVHGIIIGGNAVDLAAEANVVRNCTLRGIWVGDRQLGAGGPYSPKRINVHNNIVDTCGSTNQTHGGIVLEAFTTAPMVGVSIRNNKVYNCFSAGIFIHADGTVFGVAATLRKIAVCDNFIQDTNGGAASGLYVYAQGTNTICEHLLIEGNQFWDSGVATQTNGIFLNFSGAATAGIIRKSTIAENDLDAGFVTNAINISAPANGGGTDLTTTYFRGNKGVNNGTLQVGVGGGLDTSSAGSVIIGQTNATGITLSKFVSASAGVLLAADLRRSRQTPTEAVLVSGVDATAGELVGVTLTAARLVGVPLNPQIGQRLAFTLIQSGAGAFAVTWNAVFKGITGGTSGATPTRATFSFNYDGTNWNLDGAQPTWV